MEKKLSQVPGSTLNTGRSEDEQVDDQVNETVSSTPATEAKVEKPKVDQLQEHVLLARIKELEGKVADKDKQLASKPKAEVSAAVDKAIASVKAETKKNMAGLSATMKGLGLNQVTFVRSGDKVGLDRDTQAALEKIGKDTGAIGMHIGELDPSVAVYEYKKDGKLEANQAAYDALYANSQSKDKDWSSFSALRKQAFETMPSIVKLRKFPDNGAEVIAQMSAPAVIGVGTVVGLVAGLGTVGPAASGVVATAAAVAGMAAGATIGITIVVASVPVTYFVCEKVATLAANSIAAYLKLFPSLINAVNWTVDQVRAFFNWLYVKACGIKNSVTGSVTTLIEHTKKTVTETVETVEGQAALAN